MAADKPTRLNIRPLHNSFQDVSSSSTHINLVSDYNQSQKAYKELQNVITGSTHSTLKTSGYQYLLVGISSSIEVNPSDNQELTDSTNLNVTLTIDEHIELGDDLLTLPLVEGEEQELSDSATFNITLTIDEHQELGDDAKFPVVESEEQTLTDSVINFITINIDEAIPLSDSGSAAFEAIEFTGCVTAQIKQLYLLNDTVVVRITDDIIDNYTTNINIIEKNLVLTTNASSTGNVFTPVVILNGSTVINPSGIVIEGASSARCLVYFDQNQIGQSCANKIFNWSININQDGGTWSLTTLNPIGNLGDQLTIFGLTGTITDKGRERSNSIDGYTTSGIFGAPLLHKQLAFVLFGNKQYTDLIPGQTLLIPNPDRWKSASDAARAIADVAGISINWLTHDVPIVDFFREGGITAIEALRSLANRVGGVLRWNGGLKYSISYPDVPTESRSIIDCCLLNGIAFQEHLDLELGITGTGVQIIPIIQQYDSTQTQIPDSLSTPTDTVVANQLIKTQTVITNEMPPFVKDLPYNFDSVYIQILTRTDGTGTYVTTDPKKFFLLNTGIGGRYVNNFDIGGVLQPHVILDSSLFPTENTDVDNGNFWLTVAYTTKSLGDAYDSRVKQREDEIRNILQYQELIRYVETYRGSIDGIFYGEIYMPGMFVTATLGDLTVDGIVQSFSFSYPHNIQISVSKFKKLNFIQRKIDITAA